MVHTKLTHNKISKCDKYVLKKRKRMKKDRNRKKKK